MYYIFERLLIHDIKKYWMKILAVRQFYFSTKYLGLLLILILTILYIL